MHGSSRAGVAGAGGLRTGVAACDFDLNSSLRRVRGVSPGGDAAGDSLFPLFHMDVRCMLTAAVTGRARASEAGGAGHGRGPGFFCSAYFW